MTDVPHNPNDPAFLLSKRLDEPLTEAEQQRLDAWLAEDPAGRSLADQFRRVHDLLGQRGTLPADFDWDMQAQRICARIHAEVPDDAVERDLAGVDRLIEQWAQPQPEMDWDRFAGRVMQRLSPHKRPKSPVRWIIRIGAPLAAAAAVLVLTLTARVHMRPVAEVAYRVGYAHTVRTESDAMAIKPEVSVVFKRSGTRTESYGVSYMSVGATPPAPQFVEALPL